MDVQELRIADAVILAVSGDLTIRDGNATALADRVRNVVLRGHRRVVLDVGNVRYVDSSGVAELVQANAAARNRGASVQLMNVTKRLESLLVLMHLASVFEPFAPVPDAKATVDTPVQARVLRFARTE
jgi:anti-sigma B factor antagonist